MSNGVTIARTGWSTLAAIMVLALFASGPADAQQKRKPKPVSDQPAAQSGQTDLPVPSPGSMGGGGQGFPQTDDSAGGPPDISGGNGQMLTRSRKF